MKKIIISIFSLLLLHIPLSKAAEEIKVCGQYQRMDESWSHGYKLTGHFIKKSELEKFIEDKNPIWGRYYFVINWRKGGYTYFRVENDFLDQIKGSGETYEDQTGRLWLITNSWKFCE